MRMVPARMAANAVAFALLFLISTAGFAAAQGTITGRVTAQGTGEAILETRVLVVGTSLVATTGTDGRYTLRGVPNGAQQIRVLRVGFAEQKKGVDVAAGQTATLDFVLSAVVVKLAEVVTTATGEARRVELGNTVSNINAAQRTATAPVKSLADVLAGQAPGVQVASGSVTGSGARVRIRGTSSLSLSSDPIYVIDGVRMTSSTGSVSPNIFVGSGDGRGTQTRALDINPDDIENIEIVKGPSAATLYGTDAANGVIVITTKHGRGGPQKWTAFGETGLLKDRNTYPTAYTTLVKGATALSQICRLTAQAAGTCTPDSLRSYSLFTDPTASPIGSGSRRQGGVQLSGGSETLRYFSSGQFEDEIGVYQIPSYEISRLDTIGGTREEWIHPNRLSRQNLRANINASPSGSLDVSVNTGFVHSTTRIPQTDNNSLGLLSHAYGGPGFVSMPSVGYNLSSTGAQLHGYRASTPGDIFQNTTTQEINRFIGSTNANWRPISWLANRANVGIDYTARQDQQLCRRGTCADIGSTRLGLVEDDRASINTFSADVGSTATFAPAASMNFKTTVGAQYVNAYSGRNGSGTSNLAPGTQTVSAGATPFSDEATSSSRTLGLFIEEAAAFRDRLFLTAALRTDQNSAFGTNFQRVVYPKLSASYLISEESFFPKPRFLSELRLRAALGESGVQPGPLDALRFYAPATVNINAVDQPAVQFSTLGNSDLRPERAREFEGGFDARMFDSRVTLEATYYSKVTKDALISAVIPPSAGSGATTRRQNLGSVKNAGAEMSLNAQLVDRRNFAWSTTLSGSMNENKLVTLGEGIQPIVGATIRQVPGFPLNGYWQRQILSYDDKDKNGIITASEVVVDTAFSYIGYSIPRYEATLSNGIETFNRKVRINAMFDYKGGNMLLNGTERIRCQNRNNCRGLFDQTAPLFEQARVVALRDDPSRTQAGYMEGAGFVRFRELSVTADMPQIVAAHLRASTASITFAGRNLFKWTSYSGIDPESNADAGGGGTLSAPSDFQTSPPVTFYTVRLNLGF